MITLKNLDVIFNKDNEQQNHVLKDINLQINQGQFVTVIGGNGAGKSTLINILAGDILPTNGKILLDDLDVTGKASHERARNIARVFQSPYIGTFAELSIEENMAIAYRRGETKGLHRAIDNDLRKQFKEDLVDLNIGLEARLSDKASSLSGGQRQALSLVMAVKQKSKILLLDEHTAALDPKMAKTILKITDNIIKKHQLTALMITHSMKQALEYGERTIMMQHGMIVKDLQGQERHKLDPVNLLEFFDLQ